MELHRRRKLSLVSSVLDCGQILANTEICRQIFIKSLAANLTDFHSAVLSWYQQTWQGTVFFSFSVQRRKKGKRPRFRPLLLRTEMRTVRQWAKYCFTRHHSLLKLSLLLNPLQLLEIHKGGLGKESLGTRLSMCRQLEL